MLPPVPGIKKWFFHKYFVCLLSQVLIALLVKFSALLRHNNARALANLLYIYIYIYPTYIIIQDCK